MMGAAKVYLLASGYCAQLKLAHNAYLRQGILVLYSLTFSGCVYDLVTDASLL